MVKMKVICRIQAFQNWPNKDSEFQAQDAAGASSSSEEDSDVFEDALEIAEVLEEEQMRAAAAGGSGVGGAMGGDLAPGAAGSASAETKRVARGTRRPLNRPMDHLTPAIQAKIKTLLTRHTLACQLSVLPDNPATRITQPSASSASITAAARRRSRRVPPLFNCHSCDCSDPNCTELALCSHCPLSEKEKYSIEKLDRVTPENFPESLWALQGGPSRFSWRATPAQRMTEQLTLMQKITQRIQFDGRIWKENQKFVEFENVDRCRSLSHAVRVHSRRVAWMGARHHCVY
eukprot:GABV01008623.1.p1 GENE.GABV01008623.1~~GABV01008623.1.p1  ORF type:complete len:290 (+),score=104.33 GABV01008623.1:201-1070(+)